MENDIAEGPEQQQLVALPIHQHGSRSLIGLLVSLNGLARKLYKLIDSLAERQRNRGSSGDFPLPSKLFPVHSQCRLLKVKNPSRTSYFTFRCPNIFLGPLKSVLFHYCPTSTHNGTKLLLQEFLDSVLPTEAQIHRQRLAS